MRGFLISAILALCIFQSACTRSLPNTVSAYEYSVYSAWLTRHVEREKDRTQEILIQNRTFPVKNFDPEHCGLPRRLLQPLLDAGDAEYRINATLSGRITAPFEFRFVDEAPPQPTKSFELISFSRIAFTVDYSEGLFLAWSDHRCERSNVAGDSSFLCGGGRANFVLALKTAGRWEFRSAGNCMVVE